MMGMDMAGGGLSAGAYGRSPRMEAARASKSNDETTGDLHMRQEKYDAAVLSYEKSLRLANIKDPYTASKIPAGYRFQQSKDRQLFEKLARALIAAAKYDKARQVLDNLSRVVAAGFKAKEKSSLQFPAQLVVSVKKADLDAIAAGKIKSEEFRKRATLRYFDPAALRRDESKSGRENGKGKKLTNLKGVIQQVETKRGLVWINLGALDGLSIRAVFDVYSKVDTTAELQVTFEKGRIEVTRIVGPHLAEARIVDNAPNSRISPGDRITSKTRSAKAK